MDLFIEYGSLLDQGEESSKIKKYSGGDINLNISAASDVLYIGHDALLNLVRFPCHPPFRQPSAFSCSLDSHCLLSCSPTTLPHSAVNLHVENKPHVSFLC